MLAVVDDIVRNDVDRNFRDCHSGVVGVLALPGGVLRRGCASRLSRNRDAWDGFRSVTVCHLLNQVRVREGSVQAVRPTGGLPVAATIAAGGVCCLVASVRSSRAPNKAHLPVSPIATVPVSRVLLSAHVTVWVIQIPVTGLRARRGLVRTHFTHLRGDETGVVGVPLSSLCLDYAGVSPGNKCLITDTWLGSRVLIMRLDRLIAIWVREHDPVLLSRFDLRDLLQYFLR